LDSETGANWREELLRLPDDAYTLPGVAATRYEPFTAALIAEPSLEATVVDPLAICPALRSLYAEPQEVLLSPEEVERVRRELCPRFDSILGPKHEYKAYFRRPEVQALWTLRPADEMKASCSIAAVLKKNLAQRKILMVVPFNSMMRSVPDLTPETDPYGLQGPGALAAYHIDGEQHVGTLDESNAFTFLMAPE